MILGIDPGVVGAYAILNNAGIVCVDDLPSLRLARSARPKVTRPELNLYALRQVLLSYPVKVAVIEQVNAMPKQGVTSMFRFGEALGGLCGLMIGLQIPLFKVRPQEWQRYFRIGAGPDAARQHALQLYPSIAQRLVRKKDVHRADALLIATWGWRHRTQPQVEVQSAADALSGT
jgi:crossover junction endodeoxyribonuclease RuvC